MSRNRKNGGWEKAVIIELLGNRCAFCNRSKAELTRVPRMVRDLGSRLELDHVLPLKKGGSNRASNLRVLCNFCHRQRHHNGADKRLRADMIPGQASLEPERLVRWVKMLEVLS